MAPAAAVSPSDADPEAPPGQPSHDLIEQIKQRDLPSKLREQISRQTEFLMTKLSTQADQLRVVGGDRGKLKRQDIVEEHANECALARLAYKASELAKAASKAYEMTLHDPLTLLKSATFFGFLLNALGEPSNSRFRCVWACASLDHFVTGESVKSLTLTVPSFMRALVDCGDPLLSDRVPCRKQFRSAGRMRTAITHSSLPREQCKERSTNGTSATEAW